MARAATASRIGAIGVATATLAAGFVGLATHPAVANGHPQFSASGPLTFAAQALGSTSATQIETITNLADSDVNKIEFGASAVSLAGTNASDFSIVTDTCSGATLLAQGTCTVAIAFTPTALGARNANLNFVFTGVGNLDPTSPQDIALSGTGDPLASQGPLNNCVTTPKKLPAAGTKRLTAPGCVTNAGAKVRVAAQLRSRGDVRIYKVIRRANGASFIKTFGRSAKIRVFWAAPAAPGFTAYVASRTYKI